MKTCPYNIDPLKPHFYIVKLGFKGAYIIFSYFCSKHRLWVLVRTENFQFLEVKFSIYLNRRVYVMEDDDHTLRMRRWICVFSGHTCNLIGNSLPRLDI